MKQIFAVAYILALLAATLWPQPVREAGPLVRCIICGPRGLADAVLNIVMTVPIGLLLGGRIRLLPVLAIGFATSAAIESAQLFIPGRDPSAGDLLFNTLGAGLGVLLLRAWPYIRSEEPRRRDVLAVAWTTLVLGVLFLTGWLQQPVLPPAPYTVAWAPDLPDLATFNGEVRGAALGPHQIRPGPVASAERWRGLLTRGAPLGAAIILGEPTERLAPVLTVHDLNGTTLMLLGVDGGDVVFQRVTRANAWRLDSPSFRLPDALAPFSPDDTVLLATLTLPSGQCFTVRQQRTCGLGHSAGSGWNLLVDPDRITRTQRTIANAVWLAILVLPLGFVGRWQLTLPLLAVIGWYAAVRLPYDTVLLPIEWPEAAGIIAGVAAGAMTRRATAGSAPT